jgi:mannosyltransferase
VCSAILKEDVRVQRRYLMMSLMASVFLISVLVRLHALGETSIWSDEAFTLILSSYSPSQIIFHTAQDVHPPLYYLFLHAWMMVFGDGVFSARSLSVVAGCLSVMMGMWWLLLISTKRAAILGGVILALLPIAVRYSQEIRMYSLFTFFMMGATVALVYWVNGNHRKWAIVLYAILMAAGLYTHYFAAVCMASHWAYLLVLMLWRDTRYKYFFAVDWWLANVAIVCVFMAWVPSLLHQLKFSGFNWVVMPSVNTVVSAIWGFLHYTDGLMFSVWIYYSLPVVVFVMSLIVVAQDKSRKGNNTLLVVYTWFPLLLIVVVSFFYPLFVERYFIFAAMGLPMILAIALDNFMVRKVVGCYLVFLLIIISEVVGVGNVYRRGHAVSDEVNRIDVLSAYLNKYAVSNDDVLVTNGFLYFPFVYYNNTTIVPKLYTPPKMDGASGRPNGYQIWTLVENEVGNIYMDNYECVNSKSGRIWVLGSDLRGSKRTVFPQSWRLIRTFIAGDAQVQLFETDSPDSTRISSTCLAPTS